MRREAYSKVDRLNHWTIALVVIGLIIVGWVVSFDLLDKDTARGLRDNHKAIGLLVFAFALWRVAWRLIKGFPEKLAGMPAWQERSARLAHYVLMACILIMPVAGLSSSYFGGRSVKMFGLFEIPPAAEKVPALKEIASGTHYFLGILLTLLVVIHIAAALKHHFVDRDATLTRMTRGG